MDLIDWFDLILHGVLIFGILVSVVIFLRLTRVLESTERRLTALERSQEPARDIQDRLVYAIEASGLLLDGTDPTSRRAEAQKMAASMFVILASARLTLVSDPTPV